MTRTEAVYRSCSDLPAQRWQAWTEAHDAWIERCLAFEIQHGSRMMTCRVPFTHQADAVGMAPLPDGSVPAGWQQLKGRNYLTPNRRSAAGKAISQQLHDLRSPDIYSELIDATGLPEAQLTGNRIVVPAMHQWDGVVWVYWSAVPLTRQGKESVEWDGNDHWERARMSDYHLSREAREAANAAAVTG